MPGEKVTTSNITFMVILTSLKEEISMQKQEKKDY